ncbi:LOW QUALITY PROTEIN: hypothetical protein ACHAWO_002461 [Cyclotella atomus]|uniref:Lysosomal dipeptide transporter MFSD1 n=1 Tax=Cyclotella atomus TaxID=382360 RepID=A0ABD3NKE0_9STRA
MIISRIYFEGTLTCFLLFFYLAVLLSSHHEETDTTAITELDDLIDDEAVQYELPLNPPQNQSSDTPNNSLKKSSFRTRWLVLILCCLLMSSNYYAYDIPSALHQQIQTYMPQSSIFETKFNLLYTAYSIPNTILPLFGGNVVDRYGAPKCQTLFAVIIFSGSFILSVGVSSQSWQLMYFGRFVFGLGAESLSVAQSTGLSEWFEGREVALAMGIALSVSRLGSIWNNLISPKVANAKNGGVESAFRLGAFRCYYGRLIIFVDARTKRKIEKRSGGGLESLTAALLEGSVVESDFLQSGGNAGNLNAMDEGTANQESEAVHISDIKKFQPLFWLLSLSCVVVYGCVLPFNNVASGILLERNLVYLTSCFNDSSNIAVNGTGSQCTTSPSQAPVLPNSVNYSANESNMSSTWDKTEYIYPALQSTNVHCGDAFWFEGCTVSYCAKERTATEHAGQIMSIPYLISSISSPLLTQNLFICNSLFKEKSGHLVDKVGKRAVLATAASGILLVVHLTLAMTDISPIGPMILQGTAYSLYAAVIWPSVPLAVSKQYTGTAFGVITSIQNMGLALFPLIIASIYNTTGSYIPNVEIFFATCAAVGVLVGLLMIRVDRRTGGKLNAVSSGNKTDPDNTDSLRMNENYFDPLATDINPSIHLD